MNASYELLLGLALLAERQKQQKKILQGWTGVLVKLEQTYLLLEREIIKEIVTLSLTAPVIDKRKWLAGVMSHEGTLLPLIELRKILNPQASYLGLKERKVIIFSGKNGSVGLLVDQIIGSRDYWFDDLALSDINNDPENFFSVSFSYEGRRINIVDHRKLSVTIGLIKR
jgi:chemotaxis signal transduction protein